MPMRNKRYFLTFIGSALESNCITSGGAYSFLKQGLEIRDVN